MRTGKSALSLASKRSTLSHGEPDGSFGLLAQFWMGAKDVPDTAPPGTIPALWPPPDPAPRTCAVVPDQQSRRL
jgi:hypothetical protein